MTRMHVNLQVKDLEQSVVFYSRLFGVPPTVRRPGYAKWMLEDPRVNFALGAAAGAPGIEHLGIQAETREELEALRGRLTDAGPAVEHEGETVCCYAQSDKTWVTDGNGVAWEMFYTHGSAETYYAPTDSASGGRGERCCGPACCAGQRSAPPASAACC